MEGWRDGAHAPSAQTAAAWGEEARTHEAIAAVPIDLSKGKTESNPLGYTLEELEASARFSEASRSWARVCRNTESLFSCAQHVLSSMGEA